MPYLLIRQKFADYLQWRTTFDSLTEIRRDAGMNLVFVARNAADLNEAVVLFEISDPERARKHAGSPVLWEAHQRAGVIEGSSEIVFLHDAR